MANLRHQSPRSRKFKFKLNHEPPAEAVFYAQIYRTHKTVIGMMIEVPSVNFALQSA
jgi:hypothetical protein